MFHMDHSTVLLCGRERFKTLTILLTVLCVNNLFAQIEITGSNDEVTFSGDVVSEPGSLVQTYRMFLDTTEDILLIDAILTFRNGTLTGNDHCSIDPLICAPIDPTPLIPEDSSWLQAPGTDHAALPGPIIPGPDSVVRVGFQETATGYSASVFDSSPDGPQTGFQFANIKVIPNDNQLIDFTFAGTLQTVASPTPLFTDFTYNIVATVPEPRASVMFALLALTGLLAKRRSRVGYFADTQ